MFFSVLATFCFAEDVILQDESIPFLYESRAEISAPEHKLAAFVSIEYRNARDEFTRHDLFQKIKPVLDKRLQTAKQTKSVKIHVKTRLGEYDFTQHAFSTGFLKLPTSPTKPNMLLYSPMPNNYPSHRLLWNKPKEQQGYYARPVEEL